MSHAYAQRVGACWPQGAAPAPASRLPRQADANPRRTQVAELEAESAALQEGLNQKHLAMKSMERKLASYEVEVQELQQKVGGGRRAAPLRCALGVPEQRRDHAVAAAAAAAAAALAMHTITRMNAASDRPACPRRRPGRCCPLRSTGSAWSSSSSTRRRRARWWRRSSGSTGTSCASSPSSATSCRRCTTTRCAAGAQLRGTAAAAAAAARQRKHRPVHCCACRRRAFRVLQASCSAGRADRVPPRPLPPRPAGTSPPRRRWTCRASGW